MWRVRMVSWLVGTAWLMHLWHVRCVHGLLSWLSMLALRTVCSLQLRVCRRGFSWPLLAVPSVVPPTWTLAASPAKQHTRHLCKLCGHRWTKSPPVIGNPLAALGCYLEGATLYVGRVPCTAGDQQGVRNHVGCMSGDSGTARVEGSCVEASAL